MAEEDFVKSFKRRRQIQPALTWLAAAPRKLSTQAIVRLIRSTSLATSESACQQCCSRQCSYSSPAPLRVRR
jgi:hypothetical protein